VVAGVKTLWFNVEIDHKEEAVIVPLEGHITELDSSEKYESWRRTDPLLLITDDEAIKKYYTSVRHVEALKKLARSARIVIIATDADEEGQSIGVLHREVCMHNSLSIETSLLRSWRHKAQQDRAKEIRV